MKTFEIPQRVWINSPSTLQPYHKFHGRVGIAHTRTNSLGYQETMIYFTEGSMTSISIDPKFLVSKNSQNNILKYGV
jgi:ribosomal protein L21E